MHFSRTEEENTLRFYLQNAISKTVFTSIVQKLEYENPKKFTT